MAQPDREVKEYPAHLRPLLGWIDHHPRTGWYLVCLFAVNLTLNVLDALDVDLLWFVR